MSTTPTDANRPQPPFDPVRVQIGLDAIKAVRQAAYERWAKRREYEWRLSISLWTALAAFAVLLFRDTLEPTRGIWGAVLTTVVGYLGWNVVSIHGRYLERIIDGTLEDLEIQQTAEIALREVAKMHLALEKFPEFKATAKIDRHGRLQVHITAILVTAIVLTLLLDIFR